MSRNQPGRQQAGTRRLKRQMQSLEAMLGATSGSLWVEHREGSMLVCGRRGSVSGGESGEANGDDITDGPVQS